MQVQGVPRLPHGHGYPIRKARVSERQLSYATRELLRYLSANIHAPYCTKYTIHRPSISKRGIVHLLQFTVPTTNFFFCMYPVSSHRFWDSRAKIYFNPYVTHNVLVAGSSFVGIVLPIEVFEDPQVRAGRLLGQTEDRRNNYANACFDEQIHLG